MPDYRRAFVPGGTFFLTLVTHDRRPSLASDQAVALLRSAFGTVQRDQPFAFDAGVVLPGHTHWIWTLPPGDADFSKRVGRIKALFTKSLDPRPAAVRQQRRARAAGQRFDRQAKPEQVTRFGVVAPIRPADRRQLTSASVLTATTASGLASGASVSPAV